MKFLLKIIEALEIALLRAYYRIIQKQYERTNISVNRKGELLLHDNKYNERNPDDGQLNEIKTGHFVAHIKGLTGCEASGNRTLILFTAAKVEFIEDAGNHE